MEKFVLNPTNQGQTHKSKTKEGFHQKKRRGQRINNVKRTKTKEKKGPNYRQRPTEFAEFSKGLRFNKILRRAHCTWSPSKKSSTLLFILPYKMVIETRK